ncbi:MAG TPA: sulfite exporter TauE/SafE family protein [Candidatus Bathyarchaeota archaeon]|nr:sulfite exporter TauE/SafE family protein [Candidatus Bathyarchaeota archaeon]
MIGVPLFVVFLILGFVVGIPASMCGLGGGFIIVPTLILAFGLSPQNAIAISLVAMCGTTVSAALGYIKQKRVDYKLALLYDVFDIPGVVVGAYLTTILPKDLLIGLCGFFILSLSVLMLRNLRTKKSSKTIESELNCNGWERKVNDSMNRVFEYQIRRPPLIVISSLLSGLVTGLVGLGGGITDTTTMILLGIPAHIAVASSEFAMALTNGAGVITHGLLQNINIGYAIPITIGTIVGAQVGVLAAKRTKQKYLKTLLYVVSLFFSVRLILEFLWT